MKRPVSLSVAEPADTPVVMVAVEADETATIGSVPLPNSARVDEDCGNSRYFVGNMKHVLHGMVVSSQKISPPYSCQRTVCKSHTIVCKNIFIQNLKIVPIPSSINCTRYSMFHVCDQSDSRTGTSFTNDVR